MLKKEIEIKNRYGYYHKLFKINDNEYKFVPDQYMRVIFENNEKTKIKAVDPYGGPWINCGMIIADNFFVEDIFDNGNDIVFKLIEK